MRFLLRILGVGALASIVVSACGGSEFSSSGSSGKGGAAGASGKGGSSATGGSADSGAAGDVGAGGTGATGGTAGTAGASAAGGVGGGGTTLCSDNAACDDANPCTLDLCGATGVCENPDKCGGDQPLCCDGECGACCEKADCDDQIDCTEDECFAGFCTHGGACVDETEYCSPGGCVPREECSSDAECADDDACTADSCVDHLCTHPTCPDGGICCEGQGCGTCCGDSQCPHDDPCEPSTCGEDLECHASSLCKGDLCCPSGDNKTATCGVCCSGKDCPDDGVECTVEKCKAAMGGKLGCFSEPDSSQCPTGQTCNAMDGCSSNQCAGAATCSPPGACEEVECKDGSCRYSQVDCSHSQECCPNTGECQDCCSNADCRDAGARLCCPATGTCAQCCADSDCVGSTLPPGEMTDAIGLVACARPYCDAGVCKSEAGTCPLTQKCCEGVGCVPLLQNCGVMTQ